MEVAPHCCFHLHAPIGSKAELWFYATEPFAFLSLLSCSCQFILLWARKFAFLLCFWKLSDINDKVVLNSALGFILGASFFGMPHRRKGTRRFLYCFWGILKYFSFSMMQMNTCSTYRWLLCVFLLITFLSGVSGIFPAIMREAKI